MLKRGRVLVVEDDPSARASMTEALKGDYEILTAGTAAEALQILKAVQVDTVTLEPWLSGLQGREILKRIRQTSPRARVIIVSGQQLSYWFDDMVREEIFDYLPKPFDPRDLVRTVGRSVTMQRVARTEPGGPRQVVGC